MGKKLCTALVSVALLAGCDITKPEAQTPSTPAVRVPPTDGELGQTAVIEVEVKGKTVTCVGWDIMNGGGVSCNWEEYNRKENTGD